MTTQATTSAQEPTTPAATGISDPNISFSDFQALRRSGAKGESTSEKSEPAATATAQKKSSESDTEENDALELSESEGDESDEGSESKDLDGSKPKKKGGFQKRIEKLNAKAAEAERKAAYWEAEALKRAKEESKPKDTQTLATGDGKPSPDSFDTHAEYVEALTDWKTDQAFKKRDQKSQEEALQAEQAKRLSTYDERMKAYAGKNPAFLELLADVPDNVQVSDEIQESIIESEYGPQMYHELAGNLAEFYRINALPPRLAAREMGKLEAKFANASAPDPAPKKLTNAPKPLDPVGKSSGAVAKSIADPNISYSDYVRLRREQKRRR